MTENLRFYESELPFDPTARPTFIDERERLVRPHYDRLTSTRDGLRAEKVVLDDRIARRVASHLDRRRRDDLKEALAQIEQGVHAGDGVIEELKFLVGKPGLFETADTLIRLRAARAAATADPEERGRYRLRPNVGDHWDGDRLVQPGEVVELTRRQVESIGDKFEPVVDTPVAS